MNIPNILTMLRFVMTIGFLYLFPINVIVASLLFVLAAVTDFFDGYLARKYDLITPFGKIMDPIADKFLILSAFAVFAGLDMVHWWMFWVIASREVGVTLFRFWAMARGKILAAEQGGKIKTVSQMAAIMMMLLSVVMYPDVFLRTTGFIRSSVYLAMLIMFDIVLLWLALVLTVMSGISVVWNNRKIFVGA